MTAPQVSWPERQVRRLDRFQQRHVVLAFPWAVMQKFGNDQAGSKAALIAYYGLFALFPLLLLLATVLGFVLSGNPALRDQLINSALGHFPVIGDQIRSEVHPLEGNTTAAPKMAMMPNVRAYRSQMFGARRVARRTSRRVARRR